MNGLPIEALSADHDVLDPADRDPRVTHLQRFPVKSLDPETPERATLAAAGALAGDREWAIHARPADEPVPDDPDVTGTGDYVNGKKTDAVHRLRSTFHPRSEPDGPAVTLRGQEESPDAARRFPLYGGAGRDGADGDGVDEDHADAPDEATVHADLNGYLSERFGREVSVRRDDRGQHDDRERHGPTVVSTATLREVGAWFDLDLAEVRRRFRATLEVGGVEPFWEDRLFRDEGTVVAVRIGDATIEGVHPCRRCVVPARDPDTGAETPEFRERFLERREATRPDWTESDRFRGAFRLTVNTRVPAGSDGTTVAVGDPVAIEGERAE